MNQRLVSAMYVLNIIFQSFFNLALPIGVSILASWLLVDRVGAPGWIYAPLVILGVAIGFSSMIRFILSAMRALDRLEAQRQSTKTEREDPHNGR